MRIQAAVQKWVPAKGTFIWPRDVEIEFSNGDVYDAFGARNCDGDSIDYNPSGTGACGSPCHQALQAAGLLPEN